MRLLPLAVLASFVSLTAACTSTGKPQPVAAAETPAKVEVVKAVQKETDKNALICKREKPLGSNRPVKVCKTVAQIREEREHAERLNREGDFGKALGGG